jgi:hypothetical protein
LIAKEFLSALLLLFTISELMFYASAPKAFVLSLMQRADGQVQAARTQQH